MTLLGFDPSVNLFMLAALLVEKMHPASGVCHVSWGSIRNASRTYFRGTRLMLRYPRLGLVGWFSARAGYHFSAKRRSPKCLPRSAKIVYELLGWRPLLLCWRPTL